MLIMHAARKRRQLIKSPLSSVQPNMITAEKTSEVDKEEESASSKLDADFQPLLTEDFSFDTLLMEDFNREFWSKIKINENSIRYTLWPSSSKRMFLSDKYIDVDRNLSVEVSMHELPY